MASASETALLIIDTQMAFNHPTYWGTSRSTPNFEANLERLLAEFRKARSSNGNNPLVVHVGHKSTNPNSVLYPSAGDGKNIDFQPYAAPIDGEPVVYKQTNSAFVSTNLGEILRNHGIRQLVICGLVTDHCVSTSTRMAKDLGVTDRIGEDGQVEKGRVIIVADATATHNRGRFDAETMHAVNLASLEGEFAEVLTTEEVLATLVETTARH